MATKETKKTPAKTPQSTADQIAQKQADLLEARKSNNAGELVNPRVITALRKDIARLKTALRSDELSAQKEEK